MVRLIELETKEFSPQNTQDLSLEFANFEQIKNGKIDFDYMLLDLGNVKLDQNQLLELVASRKILYFGGSQEEKEALKKKGHFDLSQKRQECSNEGFLDFVKDTFFKKQVAFEINPNEFALIPSTYPAYAERNGRYEIIFHGNFGQEFTEALYWSMHYEKYWDKIQVVPIYGLTPGESYEFYADIEPGGKVEYEFIFTFFENDETFHERKFTSNEFRLDIPKEFPKDSLQLALFVKGEGMLRLGKINFRRSRNGFGTLIPGDERRVLDNGEEILSYFVPGKDNRHLVVSFTGYLNELPKFEFLSLANHGFPVLFFSDSRTRGGVFQLGKNLNKEYEEAIEAKIQETLDLLELDAKALVMNGYSMGSFPSLYYGAKFSAGHIIACKPLVSIGSMTANKKLIWSFDGWFLSARHYLMEGARARDTQKLDAILFDRLKESDLKDTTVHMFVMNQDEYDGQSLPKLVEALNDAGANIHQLANEGLHTEKVPQMQGFIRDVLNLLTREEGHES